jgi:hypothetical protein
MTTLRTEAYPAQAARWPAAGRHIFAQFDDTTVVVYQAYRSSIGRATALAGYFGGGGFSLGRMSWIKPNFLWMMYRCGWAKKEGQEVVLAVWLDRATSANERMRECRAPQLEANTTMLEYRRHGVRLQDRRTLWYRTLRRRVCRGCRSLTCGARGAYADLE